MIKMAQLPGRGVIEVEGEDRVTFMQGLVSNDVAAVAPGSPGSAVWAALLTPQGKWVADFFIFSDGDRLLLDVERAQAAMLIQRLTRFRLRAKVDLHDLSRELYVHVVWGCHLPPVLPRGVVWAPDPRLRYVGWRILSPIKREPTATAEDWDTHRLALGLPDGSADLEAEKTVLLEAGFDELNGVSWSKGCYMGQELTARTKYRGLVKRRLVPVTIYGPLPPRGTPVQLPNGTEVGEMRSGRGGQGIAQLRLEAIGAADLKCGGAALTPHQPAWMVLPETAA